MPSTMKLLHKYRPLYLLYKYVFFALSPYAMKYLENLGRKPRVLPTMTLAYIEYCRKVSLFNTLDYN